MTDRAVKNFEKEENNLNSKELLNFFLEWRNSDEIIIDNSIRKEIRKFNKKILNIDAIFHKTCLYETMHNVDTQIIQPLGVNEHGIKHILKVAEMAQLMLLATLREKDLQDLDQVVKKLIRVYIGGLTHDIGYESSFLNYLIENNYIEMPASVKQEGALGIYKHAKQEFEKDRKKYISMILKSGESPKDALSSHAWMGGKIVQDFLEDILNPNKSLYKKFINKKYRKYDFFDEKSYRKSLHIIANMVNNHDTPDGKNKDDVEKFIGNLVNENKSVICGLWGDKIDIGGRAPKGYLADNLIDLKSKDAIHKRITTAVQEEIVRIYPKEQKIILSLDVNLKKVEDFVRNAFMKQKGESIDFTYDERQFQNDFSEGFDKRYSFLSRSVSRLFAPSDKPSEFSLEFMYPKSSFSYNVTQIRIADALVKGASQYSLEKYN